MKRPIVLLFHAGYWICYFFLALLCTMIIIGMITYGSEEEPAVSLEYLFFTFMFLALFSPILAFYIFYRSLFPKYLQQEKIRRSVGYGIAIATLTTICSVAIIYEAYGACSQQAGALPFIVLFIVVLLLTLISGVAALVIRGFITWYEELQLKESLQKKNQEMELALLKAKLDPHFLFNTINNIDVLMLRDTNKASNYLNKLSDIMRFMLYETKTEEIQLSQEIEYIDKYIALQKIRTANQSFVHFEVLGNPEGKTIAPMIFIPFIENAFKHTSNKKIEHAIHIEIHINAENILLKCENRFEEGRKQKENDGGLGNELIQKRLQLLYPERHELSIQKRENLYQVLLSIHYEAVPMYHH